MIFGNGNSKEIKNSNLTASTQVYPRSWRIIVRQTLKIYLILLVLVAAVAVVFIIPGEGTLADFVFQWLTITFALGIIGGGPYVFVTAAYQLWHFRSYRYDLTQDSLRIRANPKGLNERIVPYVRMQDVYLHQTVLDKVFSLFTVRAASTLGIEAEIAGLTKAMAEGLSKDLQNRIRIAQSLPGAENARKMPVNYRPITIGTIYRDLLVSMVLGGIVLLTCLSVIIGLLVGAWF